MERDENETELSLFLPETHTDCDEEEWSKPVFDAYLQKREFVKGKRVSMPISPNNDQKSGFISHLGLATSSTQEHPRTIIHIDIDCYYAQVEMIHNPALRNIPLGIQQKHIIVTCNYLARSRGVTKLMGITEAKKKCPELVLVSGEDLTRYREMSYRISEFLLKYTPCVERLGFDENFMDVTEMVEQRFKGQMAKDTVLGHIFNKESKSSGSCMPEAKPCPCGCHHRLAVGSQIAADVRSALEVELGITSCAGIAHNKLLAKLVGSLHKPNQQTTIYPHMTLDLVTSLDDVYCIPGVGWATSKRLKVMGINSVENLQQTPLARLEDEIGTAVANNIKQLSFGVDESPVVAYGKPQTLSIEDSFRNCNSTENVKARITDLTTDLLQRIKEDGRVPRTFRLTIRNASKEDYHSKRVSFQSQRESRQCTLPENIISKITTGHLDVACQRLVTLAMNLFMKMLNVKQPFHLTLINVAFAKLEEAARNSIAGFFSCPVTAVVAQDSSPLLMTSQNLSAENCRVPSDSVETFEVFSAATQSPSSTETKNNLEIGCAKLKQSDAILPVISKLCQVMPDKVLPTSSKRKQSNSLKNYFSKKHKPENDVTLPIGHCKINTSHPLTSSDIASIPLGTESRLLEEVDPEVFGQLPHDIQHEILNNVANRSSAHYQLDVNSISYFTLKDSPDQKYGMLNKCKQTDVNTICELKDSAGSHHCQQEKGFFKKLNMEMSKLKNVGDHEPDQSTDNSETLLRTEMPNQSMVLPALHSSTLEYFSLNHPELMKGIDVNVFSLLPDNIQKEIAADLVATSHQKKKVLSVSHNKVNSLLNYFKKST